MNERSRFLRNLRNPMVYAAWFMGLGASTAGLILGGAPASIVGLYIIVVGAILLAGALLILPPLKSDLDKLGIRVGILISVGVLALVFAGLVRLS